MFLLKSIGLQLVIITSLGFVLQLLTGFIFGSYFTIATLWILLTYFTGAFNMWFIHPKANTAVVLSNMLKSEVKLTTDRELTGMQKSNTMRVAFGPTFRGKYPWEKIVDGKAISLVLFPLGKTLIVYTSDNVKCTVNWTMFYSTIQNEESIINLLRTGDESAKIAFISRAESFIEAEVKTMKASTFLVAISDNSTPGTTVSTGRTTLNTKFSKMLGGDDALDDFEKSIGMKSCKLTISNIVLDSEYQAAMQGKATAEESAKALEVYTSKKVSPDVAANMVWSDKGKKEPTTVTRHIFEFKDMPPGVHLVVGDVDNSGKHGK